MKTKTFTMSDFRSAVEFTCMECKIRNADFFFMIPCNVFDDYGHPIAYCGLCVVIFDSPQDKLSLVVTTKKPTKMHTCTFNLDPVTDMFKWEVTR